MMDAVTKLFFGLSVALSHQAGGTSSPRQVIEGDLLLPQGLEAAWAARIQSTAPIAAHPTSLIVNTLKDNSIDTWLQTQRHNLSYCVSDDFRDLKPRVLAALRTAVKDWKSAADVSFVYVGGEDMRCTTSNTRVLFNIEPSVGERFLAATFFPSYPRSDRHFIVDKSAFTFSDIGLAGIFRHELGHVLGFRHEHIRQESDHVCDEDLAFQPLTEYDRRSVMHYPQCGGENDIRNLVLTDLDRTGAALVYPSALLAAHGLE